MSTIPTTSALPVNPFKRAISRRDRQIGLWTATGSAYVAEMIAGTGYDWLLIDGEHAPNDLRSTLAQLQAISSGAATLPPGWAIPHPVVRLPVGDPVLIKQYMELGVQTVLVPMVETPQQALALARAMRYPPEGTRGMGSGLARSSRWSRYGNYIHEANEEACLLVQVETIEALHHIDAIAATPGVDGVFIGPADLSASMGLRGQANHPAVVDAIRHAVERIHLTGKASGILATVEAQANQWIDAGVTFIAVGVDISLFAQAAKALAARFQPGCPSASVATAGY